jgi:hypothetical protein
MPACRLEGRCLLQAQGSTGEGGRGWEGEGSSRVWVMRELDHVWVRTIIVGNHKQSEALKHPTGWHVPRLASACVQVGIPCVVCQAVMGPSPAGCLSGALTRCATRRWGRLEVAVVIDLAGASCRGAAQQHRQRRKQHQGRPYCPSARPAILNPGHPLAGSLRGGRRKEGHA